jgi:hypothetical protein
MQINETEMQTIENVIQRKVEATEAVQLTALRMDFEKKLEAERIKLEKKTTDMSNDIAEIKKDIKEIKTCLLGSKEGVVKVVGVLEKNDEMFNNFIEYKVALKLIKWVLTFLGLTSFAGIISQIILWKSIL